VGAEDRVASIIIPTLNERVTEPLSKLDAYLKGIDGWRFEVLIVDDSRDEHRASMREEIQRLSPGRHMQIELVEGGKTGKGGAVRRGVESASGSVIFLVDCDLPVPLEQFREFLHLIENGGADAVIAERPAMHGVRRPLRIVLTYGLLVMQRVLVFQSSRFTDTQCGFKAFRAELIRAIADRQVVDGGMFDLEYLYAAVKRGAKIVTVPVEPNPETRESRVNLWSCIRRDPIDVVRIKMRGLTGGYA
jgi:glycosyltransferase involved in cell wall biosynthesis